MIYPLAAEAQAVFNGCPICYHDSKAGHPIPGPQTGTGPLPVMNEATQQVSSRPASEASAVFAAAPQR